MSFKIEKLFAFVVEHSNGQEGIIASFDPLSKQWTPLVGGYLHNIDTLKPEALSIANHIGKPVKVLLFSAREQVDIIEPIKPFE